MMTKVKPNKQQSNAEMRRLTDICNECKRVYSKKILYSDDKSEHKVSQKNDVNSHVKQDMSSKQFTIYLEDEGSQWTQVEKVTQSHNNKNDKTKLKLEVHATYGSEQQTSTSTTSDYNLTLISKNIIENHRGKKTKKITIIIIESKTEIYNKIVIVARRK